MLTLPAATSYAKETGLRTVHITRALWSGDPLIIEPIRDVSFDFMVSTREMINGSDMGFVDLAGNQFTLAAEGQPDLAATVSGGFGDPADSGFKFKVSDLDRMAEGVAYRLIPPSVSNEYVWVVEEGVRVVKNGRGGEDAAEPRPAPVKTDGGSGYGSDIDPDSDRTGDSLFTDVPSQFWAFAAIKDLNDRKVISGYPDGKFRPERIVTRAEFAKIMVLAAGLTPTKVDATSFDDIAADDWSAPFVEAAKQYLSGYKLPDGRVIFNPDAPALREDIAVAIVKLKGYGETRLPDLSLLDAMFADADGISAYAKDEVAIAVENKLMSGFPDETFRAQKPITRAEAAAILYRAYQFGSDNKQ